MRPSNDRGAEGSLVRGALWMSVGLTVSAASFLLAPPGGRFLLAYGAAAAGIASFASGLIRFQKTGAPFPWRPTGIAAGAPIVVGALLVGLIFWQRDSRRTSRKALEDARLQSIHDAAEKRRIEEQAAAQQKLVAEANTRDRLGRIARAREQLQTSDHNLILCDAATAVGNEAAREAIPDLLSVLGRATAPASVRNCAAGILVGFGVIEEPLAFYKECIRVGTSEARSIAASGLGEIGPSVADVALPLLAEQIESPHLDVRYASVEALGKLGPLAHPLLTKALRDSDNTVRALAKAKLAKP